MSRTPAQRGPHQGLPAILPQYAERQYPDAEYSPPALAAGERATVKNKDHDADLYNEPIPDLHLYKPFFRPSTDPIVALSPSGPNPPRAAALSPSSPPSLSSDVLTDLEHRYRWAPPRVLLGVGRFGKVEQAVDRPTGRLVAIKTSTLLTLEGKDDEVVPEQDVLEILNRNKVDEERKDRLGADNIVRVVHLKRQGPAWRESDCQCSLPRFGLPIVSLCCRCRYGD